MMSENKYATPFPLLHAASLLSQKTRIRKFAQALEKVITPETSVVDIGTGTGVLALIAAQKGAKHVTAIDVNSDSIRYAQEAAKINGLDKKVEFIESHFADFVPKEPADIVICEMLSSIMLIEQQVPACKYALEHIVAETGIILPNSATVYIVPVECENMWDRFAIENLQFPKLPQTVSCGEYRDLANLAELVTFDFNEASTLKKIDKTVEFEIVTKGTIHGVVGLFEGRLYEEIRLKMEDGWRELFIPFTKPHNVRKGEKIRIRTAYYPGKVESIRVDLERET